MKKQLQLDIANAEHYFKVLADQDISNLDRGELQKLLVSARGLRGMTEKLLNKLEECQQELMYEAFEQAARTVDTFEKLNERLDTMCEKFNRLSERN